MTISQAIDLLQKLKAKHGDVQLYFDCPRCDLSFTPTTAVAVAAHFEGTAKK